MPKQISPVVKIKGKIDQLNFFETADGYMVQKTARYSIEKFRTAKSYDLTRRNASEFGIAGAAGKIFRTACSTEVSKAGDPRLVSRVTRTMVKVLQSDTESEYGSRNVHKGSKQGLVGLEFNDTLPFSQAVIIEGGWSIAVGRPSGLVNITLPALIPYDKIHAPKGTTHYHFFAAAAAIDFVNGQGYTARAETVELPWSKDPAEAGSLQMMLPANSPHPIFVVLGIEFKKIVNGKSWDFTDQSCAAAVLAVSEPA
ncbi:hypothetical protein HB364_29025 [Pseudoflavitalea sp. X16]|uniref:hypothetical protein n=1 Tax=Paraflavitalea devenefica TaxID=2716334 RepID=UPI0014237F11|nr:hypothetical protein [Paraflavitalea devenefica]NII29157.1 hypothetical protein [Paraflavitalea devenefica]